MEQPRVAGGQASSSDSLGKRYMTDLKEKLVTVGDQLRDELNLLTIKDQAPRNEAIDIMSAGKERKNDTIFVDEKIYDRILAEDKAKDIGTLNCFEVDSKKEFMVIGTKKNHVILHNLKTGLFKPVKMKTKGPITCVAINKSVEYVAVGGDGGVINLLKIAKDTLDTYLKIEGFTKETIKDVKFTEVGFGLVALDYSESIFNINVQLVKGKPSFDTQVIQTNVKGARLSHLNVITPPRLDGGESKVRLLYVGGFVQSLLFRMSRGNIIQIESLETVPVDRTPRATNLTPSMVSMGSSIANLAGAQGSMLEDEFQQSFVVEDYDVIPWISPNEIKLLYVVRGSRVCVRFTYLNNDDEHSINPFSEFRLPDSIIYACLICPGVLCVIDQYNHIKFINMRKIIKSQREKKDIDFGAATYVSLKSVKLKEEQILYSEEPYGKQCKDHNPYICSGRKGRFIMICTQKKITTFELAEWEQYVMSLEKELDYLSAIQLLVEISEGDYYKLYGISPAKDRRKERMTEFIEGFVDRLHEGKVIENSTSPGAMMRIMASLLVKTGNIDYLFNTFYEQMSQVNLQAELVRIIEEYIRSGQIGSFGPDSLSGDMMAVFPEELKKKLLLECFNSSDKKGQVINMTIQNKFYDLLFYMCPKHDPVSCQFPVSLGVMELANPSDPAKAEQIMLRLLWYCESLMKGKLMFDDKIEPERSKEIQITMIKCMIDPLNAKTMAEYNLLYYLDALLLGLNETNLIYLQEQMFNESSSLRKSELYQFKMLTESSFKEFDQLFYELKTTVVGQQYPQFCLFLAIILLRGLPKVKLEIATIDSLMTTLISSFDTILKDKRIKLGEDDIQSMVFDIFTTNQANLKKSKDFTQAAENSTSVFKVMMLETKDKYEETFSVYMKLIKDKMSHSSLFFQWLKRVFTDKTDKKGASDLTKMVTDNFPFLVEIGQKESMQLWDYFDNQLKIDTTNSLSKQPMLQLDFLRRLMRVAEDRESKMRVPDSLKLMYFERLCEVSPDEVLPELNKNQWPTLQCLEICQRYNVELGVAFINKRLGRYMDALEIHIPRFARFANEFRAKISNSAKSGSAEKYFYQEVYNEDVKDGNIFKIHPLCTLSSKEYLEKLQEEHFMFKELVDASDMKLEVALVLS